MYNYSNKVNVAANQERNEIILNFTQESPSFNTSLDESGNLTTCPILQAETVANIVVTKEFAKKIAKMILSIADQMPNN